MNHNCLIRIDDTDHVGIEGYERMKIPNEVFWVFELSYKQDMETLLRDIAKTLEKQKSELKELVEKGATVTLFFEHDEIQPVKIEKVTVQLLGQIGATLEIYHPTGK